MFSQIENNEFYKVFLFLSEENEKTKAYLFLNDILNSYHVFKEEI